jgi:hypothetical protein
MRKNGSWAFNKEFIADLELEKEFEELMGEFKEEDVAFTVLVYRFMKESFKKEEEELRIIYRKVERFVAGACGRLGVNNVMLK